MITIRTKNSTYWLRRTKGEHLSLRSDNPKYPGPIKIIPPYEASWGTMGLGLEGYPLILAIVPGQGHKGHLITSRVVSMEGRL